MRKATFLAVFLLAACGGATAYQHASGPDDYGYTEARLTDNRYRVTFYGNSSTSSEAVRDYALLRAAELTLERGHDWFQVADRGMEQESSSRPQASTGMAYERRVTTDCGLLGCRTTTSPVYTGADVIVTPGPERNRYRSVLEIIMGSGEPWDPTAVYDARELSSSIRARM